jgi:hypothetical protein
MKLSQVLSSINQIEKSKFISYLDRLCTCDLRGTNRQRLGQWTLRQLTHLFLTLDPVS